MIKNNVIRRNFGFKIKIRYLQKNMRNSRIWCKIELLELKIKIKEIRVSKRSKGNIGNMRVS